MTYFANVRRSFGSALLAFTLVLGASASASNEAVLRATLPNGLKVVIVPNKLAPVVSTSLNYLVGADQSPKGFPGTAHALEHMMFRGGPGLSAAQLSRISNLIGGNFNANTRESLTQYYYNVPAADLEIALRIEAARMRDIDCDEAAWGKERGAIEQEVAAHLSSPSVQMYQKVNATLFAGTPYAEQMVGTRESFDKTPAAMLGAFHRAWYAPNNAVLIVAGDVEPKTALQKIESIFGAIAAKPLPARAPMAFKPVAPRTIALETDEPYAMVYLALRVPGLADKDLPALELLADAMQSERFELYGLKVQGKALGTFYSFDPLGHAGSVLIGAAFPAGADMPAAAKAMEANLRAILAKVAETGVSADLVEAAKLQEKRQQAQLMNSISGQASAWADSVVLYGLSSPEEDLRRIENVSVADVNRVAKTYFDLSHAVVAVLTPGKSGKPASRAPAGGAETVALEETGAVALPDWAQRAFDTLSVPTMSLKPSVSTLANGLTLIVQPVQAGDTVTVRGYIRNRSGLQEPAGKEGVAMMAQALMGFGTTHLDRLAFQAALDAVGAQSEAGTSFSAQSLSKDFERTVELLADNELHPAFAPEALAALKPQYAQFIANRRQSPDYLAKRALDEAMLPASDPDLREPTPQSVGALSRDDLLAYHKAVFRPDMTAIVVIGAVTAPQARAVVEKYFGAWRGLGPKPNVVPEPVADNPSKTVTVFDAARVQNTVWLGQSLKLMRKSEDFPAMDLGNVILGGSVFTAKLFDDLRVKRGLVYSVGSNLNAGKVRGNFIVSFASDPQNVAKAAALVRKDIVDMQFVPVSDDVLKDAKAMMLRQIPLSEESTGSIADGYLHRFDFDLPYDDPVRLAKRLVEISPGEVQAAFKRWLRPADLAVVTQGPEPK